MKQVSPKTTYSIFKLTMFTSMKTRMPYSTEKCEFCVNGWGRITDIYTSRLLYVRASEIVDKYHPVQ